MLSVRKSIAVSFAGTYVLFIINLLTTVFISRLLTPVEIGVFSVGVAIIALLHTLRNLGVSQYIIQEKELTDCRIRSALTLALLTSWPLGMIILLSARLIADVYGHVDVGGVLRILSINFFLLPYGAIAAALLRRRMEFLTLNLIQVGSGLIAATLSIGLALSGQGTLGLAWGALSGAALNSILNALMIFRSPVLLLPSVAEFRRVFSFGSRTFAASVLCELTETLPEIIVGKAQGFSAAAYLSRAQGAVRAFDQMVLSAVAPVAMPAIAAHRRLGGKMEAPYLHALNLVSGVGWPFFAFLAVVAEDLILLLFGDQWQASVRPTQVLAVAFALDLPRRIGTWVLLGTGRADLNLTVQLGWFVATTSLVIVAAQFSLTSVAAAIIIGNIVGVGLMQLQLSKVMSISLKELAVAYSRSLVIAALTLISTICAHDIFYSENAGFVRWPIWAILAFLGWFFGVVLLRHPLLVELKKLVATAVARYRR